MTDKVYMWDSYALTVSSVVKFIGKDEKGDFARFVETVFHPQGGGQLCDTGTIRKDDGSEFEVTSVVKVLNPDNPLEQIENSFEINHYFIVKNKISELLEGEAVSLAVDADRRTTSMKLHSSGHLISAVVKQQFNSLFAVSGHHFIGEARVDFSLASDSQEKVSDYKDKVLSYLPNALKATIEANYPVTIMKHPEKGRRIKIGEYEDTSCGGTHVSQLSELGVITIKGVKIQKNILRVSYSV